MPDFSVSRSTLIAASPEDVFAKVRDFRSWPGWSPWLITDPECKVVFAEDGKSYTWEGDVTGSGEIAVASEDEPKEICYQLNFIKPFKSQADVRFTFKPKEDGTEVSWIMDSSLPFFMFFMKNTMTTMIGMDYERGLLMLKDTMENGSVPSGLEFGTGEVKPMSVAGIETVCPISEVGPCMERDMDLLHRLLSEADICPTQPPLSIYHKWSALKRECHYTIGVPVPEETELPEGLVSVSIPESEAFTVKHTGPYRYLGNAWSAGFAHQRAKKFSPKRGVAPFEIYESDPKEEEENNLVTVLYFPKKSEHAAEGNA